MSLAEIKKEFVNRITTLHQQWRATNDITFRKEAQQLQYAIDLIELEEKKQQETEGKAFTVEELSYLLGLDERSDLHLTALEFLEWINNNENEIKQLLSKRGVIGK